MTEFKLIRRWAKKRGIIDNGDVKTQYIKLLEETGELAQAILKDDTDEFVDALPENIKHPLKLERDAILTSTIHTQNSIVIF